MGQGLLYVISTPIGNLEDLTFRALRLLKEADAIACEDTRKTLKLLNKYGFKKELISFYEPREKKKLTLLISLLRSGKTLALVTDSGTPGISDPGFRLIRKAIDEGIKVIPVPGPSALITALSASGLPTHKFLFMGFPPKKGEALRKWLSGVRHEDATLIFYLPTRRIKDFLSLSGEILGDREVVIARELTKVYEEFLRGRIMSLLQELGDKTLKGEATVIISGKID
jgi:16S rRNA (cytidine1402-2'-O)-methyltransferase